jgi:predicted membrane channel-forming protein YqfA (hemolysin III family)
LHHAGSVFFVMEHTVHPIGHAVWHLFVCAGAGLHYFALLQFVMMQKEKL